MFFIYIISELPARLLGAYLRPEIPMMHLCACLYNCSASCQHLLPQFWPKIASKSKGLCSTHGQSKHKMRQRVWEAGLACLYSRWSHLGWDAHRRHHRVQWQWPLSGVHSIMMENQPRLVGVGGALQALPLSLCLPSQAKLWCTLQLRGQIHSPYNSPLPLYVLCGRHWQSIS